MSKVLNKIMEFKHKYSSTIMWRINAHAKIVDANLHEGEEVLYAFAGQKNHNHFHIFNTFIIVLTNERLIFAQKRLIVGFSFNSITPDMFNDLQITSGLIWRSVMIDTIKEVVYLTNISKRSLSEIQKNITKFMIDEKKKYINNKLD